MKSKILALSKNEEFKNLLKQKKISNKYVTIFFGNLTNKDNGKLNISFVTKKKIVAYLFDTFFFLSNDLNSSFFERATILLFINLTRYS